LTGGPLLPSALAVLEREAEDNPAAAQLLDPQPHPRREAASRG